MQTPPELPPIPQPDKGPGQVPETPPGGPTEYPDQDMPTEMPPLDPGFPGMPPLTDIR